ncbi:MAG: response regulator transcription factor [Pseudomonadota bacterium]
MKILIVEDDKNLREGISVLLRSEGYETLTASDGEQGLALFKLASPDFCLLDVMMPKLDGFELCRRMRQLDEVVPILFLSAKGEEFDHVLGLELGADDFVVKPFKPRELIARIRAIARRRIVTARVDPEETQEPPDRFDFGTLSVDAAALRASAKDASAELSRREVLILWLLKQREGKVVTRDALFDFCWGRDYLPSSRALDQQISVLRRKIEADPANPRLIRTVHGEGYRYEGQRES